jgi:sulfoxide reductase heme-binding subunit YedZ
MTGRVRIAAKTAVWLAALAPLTWLGYCAWAGDLTANPIDFVTDTLGVWALRLLLASLALTPIRLLLGVAWPVAFRRLLGLFAFFYAALHLTVWVVLDHFFDWPSLGADIVKRPYVTAGMGALLLLVPLAATSTAGMIRRLGGRAWRRLHRLVYVAAGLAILHFFWLAKVGRREQYVYAAVLAGLLGIRAVAALRQAWARRAARAPTAGAIKRV